MLSGLFSVFLTQQIMYLTFSHCSQDSVMQKTKLQFRASDSSWKKVTFHEIFREKLGDIAGFSQEKVKTCQKIDQFHKILAEKSQILRFFQEQIHSKISQFHRRSGANFAKKQSVKNSRFHWNFFRQISLKLINFVWI